MFIQPVKMSVILFISTWFLFPGTSYSQAIPWTLDKLKKDIPLTELQTAPVRELLEKDRIQAIKDREMYKSDALRLIEAAHKRRAATNLLIDSLLDSRQKEKFKFLTRVTPFDRELFNLVEGLLLDDDQAFTVEGILIDHYNKLKEMTPPGFLEGDSPPPGMGNPGMFKRMINSFDSRKNRAIRKVLNAEQKERFKQLVKKT